MQYTYAFEHTLTRSEAHKSDVDDLCRLSITGISGDGQRFDCFSSPKTTNRPKTPRGSCSRHPIWSAAAVAVEVGESGTLLSFTVSVGTGAREWVRFRVFSRPVVALLVHSPSSHRNQSERIAWKIAKHTPTDRRLREIENK